MKYLSDSLPPSRKSVEKIIGKENDNILLASCRENTMPLLMIVGNETATVSTARETSVERKIPLIPMPRTTTNQTLNPTWRNSIVSEIDTYFVDRLVTTKWSIAVSSRKPSASPPAVMLKSSA